MIDDLGAQGRTTLADQPRPNLGLTPYPEGKKLDVGNTALRHSTWRASTGEFVMSHSIGHGGHRRREMDPLIAAIALAAGGMSMAVGRLAADATNTEDSIPLIAQLGVGGAIVVVAFYMLRRSDQRDAISRALEKAANETAAAVLQAQLDAERRRADAAENRAQTLEDRLIDSYRKQGPPST